MSILHHYDCLLVNRTASKNESSERVYIQDHNIDNIHGKM